MCDCVYVRTHLGQGCIGTVLTLPCVTEILPVHSSSTSYFRHFRALNVLPSVPAWLARCRSLWRSPSGRPARRCNPSPGNRVASPWWPFLCFSAVCLVHGYPEKQKGSKGNSHLTYHLCRFSQESIPSLPPETMQHNMEIKVTQAFFSYKCAYCFARSFKGKKSVHENRKSAPAFLVFILFISTWATQNDLFCCYLFPLNAI